VFTQADRTYIRENFVPLEAVCRWRGDRPDEIRELIAAERLPRAAYVLDGVDFVAPDYFALLETAGDVDALPAHFEARYLVAARRAGLDPIPGEEWRDYLSGLYAVCLRTVTPETIVAKTALVEEIERLVAEPTPEDDDWRGRLRLAVDALDELERPFSPDHDRLEPPTRVRLIEEPRGRFPEAFSASARRPSSRDARSAR
jgi:hypothetical protein